MVTKNNDESRTNDGDLEVSDCWTVRVILCIKNLCYLDWRWQQSIPVSRVEKAEMVRKNPASLRYHLLRSVPSGSTHRDVFQRKLKLYLTLAVEFGNIKESSRWYHFERH